MNKRLVLESTAPFQAADLLICLPRSVKQALAPIFSQSLMFLANRSSRYLCTFARNETDTRSSAWAVCRPCYLRTPRKLQVRRSACEVSQDDGTGGKKLLES